MSQSLGTAPGTAADAPDGMAPDGTPPQQEIEAGEASVRRLRVTAAAGRSSSTLLAAGAFVVMLIAGGLGGTLVARSMRPAAEASASHGVQWSYEGALGPEHCGEVDPRSAACKTGQAQSPINVTAYHLMQLPWLDSVDFSYKPVKARLLNNGHTLQVNYDPGSMLTFQGRQYQLTQFQFHNPSQHEFNGQRAAMELDLIHTTPDKYQNLAVVGVMIVEGKENAFLNQFWHLIPEKAGPELATQVAINASDVLPQDRSYYTYQGSLTTPPCTEGVNWIVLKQPIEASRAQIARFSALFGQNARPVQPLNDRFIEELMPGH